MRWLRHSPRRVRTLTAALCLAGAAFPLAASAQQPLEWPEVRAEARPWAYWWWPGSAVSRDDLTRLLESYRAAGLGGVHVIPIYGVRGEESRFLPFLSEEWTGMLAHAVDEARRLGLGVDATTGTGWPFGGPGVPAEDAAARIALRSFEAAPGAVPPAIVPPDDAAGGRLVALTAHGPDGAFRDLSERVDAAGGLDFEPSAGIWRLYALFEVRLGQRVERAAPGGEGLVLDFFSEGPLARYLERFDRALDARPGLAVRAWYNDSFEVPDANWTGAFLDEFRERRGYDLTRHLPALAGDAPPDEIARVKADYRETLSDLILERFVRPWTAWARGRGSLTRNEAHGMPGDLLDLYAAADVPETEQFGPSGLPIPGLRRDPDFSEEQFGRPDPLLYAFASSAGHVAGRRLVSSESATWLGEHFRVSLAQVKPELDRLFLAGINHVFLHGIPYSPPDAEWPGWLFYASTHFGPSGSLWHDFPAFAAYVARVQSFLQAGAPDQDLLLYFPVHDLWHDAEGLQQPLTVHAAEEWLYGTPFHAAALELTAAGHPIDYVSDRQTRALETEGSALVAPGGGRYTAILLPGVRRLPLPTLERLVALTEAGATVLVADALPDDVPGLAALDARRARRAALLGRVAPAPPGPDGIAVARIGRGRWLVGPEPAGLARAAGVRRETLADHGLECVRRARGSGHVLFCANLGAAPVAGWLPLSGDPAAAALFDPLTGRRGVAALRAGAAGTEVHLRLEPGASLILETLHEGAWAGPPWRHLRLRSGDALPLTGPWELTFLRGGPELPGPRRLERPGSWAGFEDAACFSGTARYAIDFEVPEAAEAWQLELGRVAESARVRLDGRPVGTVFAIPFSLRVDGERLWPGRHRLEVDVTNLAANRIRCLDRAGVPWKKFYDINFVSIRYEPFDASGWEPAPSGLLGPVRLVPADVASPDSGKPPRGAPGAIGRTDRPRPRPGDAPGPERG